jgi:hypothetical protein
MFIDIQCVPFKYWDTAIYNSGESYKLHKKRGLPVYVYFNWVESLIE